MKGFIDQSDKYYKDHPEMLEAVVGIGTLLAEMENSDRFIVGLAILESAAVQSGNPRTNLLRLAKSFLERSKEYKDESN